MRQPGMFDYPGGYGVLYLLPLLVGIVLASIAMAVGLRWLAGLVSILAFVTMILLIYRQVRRSG